MRLRHIEVFHAIYLTGSLTQAAQVLHISQPAVSKTLAHAEQQLGFALFKRERGKLLPTAEAHTLFPEIELLYRQLQGVQSLAQNLRRDAQGTIDLAITPALGFNVVPDAIAAFQRQHPGVRFRVQTVHHDEILPTLQQRKADLAIGFAPPHYPALTAIAIADVPIRALYAVDTFPQRPQQLSWHTLVQHPLIDIFDSGPVGQLIWQQLEQAQLTPQSTQQVDTYFIAARLVARGLGCCVIDTLSALGNPAASVAMADLEPPLHCPIRALHLTDKPLAKVTQSFLPYLRGAVTDLIT